MNTQNIKKLLNCNSWDEFITMFFGFDAKYKKSVFDQCQTVDKNKEFFRIRKDNGNDLNKESEWRIPAPYTPQVGRFNKCGEYILYVGTSEEELIRECGIKPDEKYWLAKYKVNKDFRVGTLIKNNDIIAHHLHQIALAVHDQNKLSKEERILLKEHIKLIKVSPIQKDILLPLYLQTLIKRDVYDVTNKLWDIIRVEHPNGLRYNSTYFPFEVVGGEKCITFNGEDKGNFALTIQAMSMLDWCGAELKTCKSISSLSTFIKTINESIQKTIS